MNSLQERIKFVNPGFTVLSKKTCSIATFSIIHLIWTGLGLNQELYGECFLIKFDTY
jgi:hypothetical protein